MPANKTRRAVIDSVPRDTPVARHGQVSEPTAAPPRDPWLTVEEICAELKISRRTFDRWRAKGIGPRSERLGGHGPLRTRRSWLDAWIENGSDAA